ncbi:hypothetical protein OE88DRAFT_1504058 [Heliocybe sulcata]|uniref:Uncharacterized protein n=1 Tax=Heliocybe sulcata TaxID=5364 RepID=A0A5C3N4B9_9AGAM|nr:hypothetical protein OE88DRAFT_1504058 [Heliocybe sulcata]
MIRSIPPHRWNFRSFVTFVQRSTPRSRRSTAFYACSRRRAAPNDARSSSSATKENFDTGARSICSESMACVEHPRLKIRCIILLLSPFVFSSSSGGVLHRPKSTETQILKRERDEKNYRSSNKMCRCPYVSSHRRRKLRSAS